MVGWGSAPATRKWILHINLWTWVFWNVTYKLMNVWMFFFEWIWSCQTIQNDNPTTGLVWTGLVDLIGLSFMGLTHHIGVTILIRWARFNLRQPLTQPRTQNGNQKRNPLQKSVTICERSVRNLWLNPARLNLFLPRTARLDGQASPPTVPICRYSKILTHPPTRVGGVIGNADIIPSLTRH